MGKNKNFLTFFCENSPKYPDDFKKNVVNKVGGVKSFLDFIKNSRLAERRKTNAGTIHD